MRSKHAVALLAATAALNACATVTPVVVTPGHNKDFAAFQKDDTECRRAASQAAYGTATPPAQSAQPPAQPGGSTAQWQRYFAALTQCATAHGDGVAPVPWTAAYASYLGYPYPYPAFAAPIGYGYPAGYAYGYGNPYWYDYGYPFLGGFYGYGYGFGYGYGYYGRGFGYGGGFHGGFGGGGFHGGFHH